jgi:uncharacterized protein YegL
VEPEADDTPAEVRLPPPTPRDRATRLWGRCALASLLVHLTVCTLLWRGGFPFQPPAGPQSRTSTLAFFVPKPAAAATPAPKAEKPKPAKPAVGAPRANRTGTPGTPGGRRQKEKAPTVGAGPRIAKRNGAPSMRPNPRPQRTARGGTSAAPAPKKLAGTGGARGPVKPVEEVLYGGGGRGGKQLPRTAPKAGGGAGDSPAAVVASNTKPAETPAPDAPAAAPDPGAGPKPAEKGVGFKEGAGIGTTPDEKAPERATEKPAEGAGVGAAPDPAPNGTGTEAPGGGNGTGSKTPGTGGKEGEGYGRGAGTGFGDGTDKTGGGNGGGGRGALFGVGDGGDGGGTAPVKVVYVIDVSLSMADRNKLNAAKRALLEALSQLKPQDSFNVVAFAGDTVSLAPRLITATPPRLALARAFVNTLSLAEGTNLGAALDAALGDPRADVNTVYILTDGQPTVGERSERRLRRMALGFNNGRAKINCIAVGFGQAFEGVDLLRKMAGENGGEYRYIDMRREPDGDDQ